VCANRIPRKVGGIALVHMLSRQGRILGEMTVTSWPKSAFTRSPPPPLSCGIGIGFRRACAPRAGRDRQRHRAARRARSVGAALARDPRRIDRRIARHGGVPWLTGREIRVAGHDVRALRVSYVGELGWELHPKIGSMAALYEALWSAAVSSASQLRSLCGQQHARREGLQSLVHGAHQRAHAARGGHARFFAAKKDDFIGKTRRLSRRRARSRSCMPRWMRPTAMRAAASPCWRRRPLHRVTTSAPMGIA